MLRFLTVFSCLLVFCLNCCAQVISPLNSHVMQATAKKPRVVANARTTATGDTLQLPFFDDFAFYTGQPSADYWQTEGGVYVNNQFGVNPPSVGVATFEGINAAGMPYSNISQTTYGYTDVLTSKPIALHNLNPATANLYLSFYWQAGGLGFSPNTYSQTRPSFLALEFKDKSGNWISVWQQLGENKNTEFTPVVIAVTNPDYYYKGFQFRFRSSGVQKGTDDTWNLDYIYLNRNRNPEVPVRPDVAISQDLNSFLKRYTAMPANQFFVNPAAEVNDSAFTQLNNFNNQFAPITWRGYTKVLTNGMQADTFLRGNAALPPLASQYLISGKPNATAIPNNSNQLLIRHAVFLNTLEKDVQLRQNDTVSRLTELHNYFAYDDGTAEADFSLNKTGNRQLAYRFDLNAPDYVRAVRVYLTKTLTETSLAGKIITFRVWNEVNGNPADTPLSTTPFTIPPTDSLNQFFEVAFPSPVPVTNNFYVGFSLTSTITEFFNIGYDLNEQAPGRIKYNNQNGTGWLSLSNEPGVLPGALMLRPVMGNITSTDDDLAVPTATVMVYPNPSSGLVHISGAYEQLSLTDVTGRLIFSKTQAAAGSQLNLNGLAKGVYLLHITYKKKTETKKIILIH